MYFQLPSIINFEKYFYPNNHRKTKLNPLLSKSQHFLINSPNWKYIMNWSFFSLAVSKMELGLNKLKWLVVAPKRIFLNPEIIISLILYSLVRTAIIQALYVDNFSTPNKPSCSTICIYMVCHVLNLTMSFL